MNQLLLIVTIAGQRVALLSSQVQSMIAIDMLTPVPRTQMHIAGLSALRSRVLTVIDCQRSLELFADRTADARNEAVVAEHDGHFYALLVDGVEDVVEARSEPLPVRTDIGRGWERVSLGMVETDHGVLLLVDVAKLIIGPDEARAA